MPEFRASGREPANHDQRPIGSTANDEPTHRTGAEFSSMAAWRVKVDRELTTLKKRIGDHMGAEGAGGDYPHPSQRVRSMWFGEGLGALNSNGMAIKLSSTSGDSDFYRGIYWVDDLNSSPNFGEVTPQVGSYAHVVALDNTSGGAPAQIAMTAIHEDAIATASASALDAGDTLVRLSVNNGSDNANIQVSTTNGPRAKKPAGNTNYISLDPDWTEKTIATGAITITGSGHIVDTQADAATDDLDTVNGGTDGQFLILAGVSAARVVTAKDGTGNLKLAGDFVFTNVTDTLMLVKQGSNWLELSRSTNA